MPPSLLPPSPEELEELRARRRRASQLKGYGEGPGMRAFQEMGDVGRGLLGAEAIIPGGEGYRTGQALANMPAVGLAAVPGKVASALPDVVTGLGALGAGVIKPKGGNWLAGSFSAEKTLGSLKRHQNPEQELAFIRSELEKPQKGEVYTQLMQRLPLAERSTALNKWIDTKLTKYVKNEMATPEDPVRALAERGTLHFEPPFYTPNPYGFEKESRTLRESREASGYPTEGLGKSNLARDWESLADVSIQPDKAEVFLPIKSELERNPWLEKVSPDTPVYGMNLNADMSGLGFPHIIDELTNAMNPNSGLPASLRLTPQQLEKVTVPQAVERVAKINEWRAAQKAEADALRARNPGTFEHKTYETVPGTAEPNQKGLRWVELKAPTEPVDVSSMLIQNAGKYSILEPGQKLSWKDPKTGRVLFDTPEKAAKAYTEHKHYVSLEDALKYEGEVMGHCVGGYCPDVIEGNSRIYSLRDKKGEPHVTIEVTPRREDTDQLLTANQLPPEIRADYERRNVLDPLMRFDPKTFLPELGQFEDEIVQIKGKGNKAPKEEYLPFVQDFVRSGNWSRVGDLKNTGLQRLQDLQLHPELVKQARERYGEYLSSSNLEELLRPKFEEGMKAGGAVELKDGGRPPIESRRKASDLPGYGQGSTGVLGDVVRGFMGEKPAEPTNPSELFRLAQALGAFPPVAGVVKGAKSAKSLGEVIDREIRKVRRLEELGKANLNVNIGRPAGPEVTGWHITQDTPGILKTGALTNRDVGAGNIQGYAPAHVGGAYFYSDPQLALAKREDLLEMLGHDPELAAQLPILRAQLRRGNRLLPDEDVGLNVPWQRSFEEGSFATGRPVMLNQVDRIYASDPDVMKDLIRDTAVRQRRYKGGGKVKASADPNEPEVRGLPDPRLDNLQIYAQTVSREMFPKDAVKRDAARHIIASSILAQKLNPSLARGLGQGYELVNAPMAHIKSALGMGPVPAGYEMDTVNNALGSEMPFTTQAELQRNARQAIESGRARLTPDEAQPYRRGGKVKIEKHPTLIADELLFKGHRK